MNARLAMRCLLVALAFVAGAQAQETVRSSPADRQRAEEAVRKAAAAVKAANAQIARAQALVRQVEGTGVVASGQPVEQPAERYRRLSIAAGTEAARLRNLAVVEEGIAREVSDPREQEHWVAKSRASAKRSEIMRWVAARYASLAAR